MSDDVFRPREDPARRIYDAFVDESSKRKGRSVEDWSCAELRRVWKECRDYSQENDLSLLSMRDVERCELSARGHTDYGSQWAYSLSRVLLSQKDD